MVAPRFESSSPATPSVARIAPAMADGHVLFVSKPTGYELLARQGEPPAIGAEVQLDGQEGTWFVTRIGLSPLPADKRPCAYLLQTP